MLLGNSFGKVCKESKILMLITYCFHFLYYI